MTPAACLAVYEKLGDLDKSSSALLRQKGRSGPAGPRVGFGEWVERGELSGI